MTSLRVFQNGRFSVIFVDKNCKFHSFEIRTAIFNNNTDV